MRSIAAIILLLVLTFPTSGIGQQLPYGDAHSPLGAVGMMKVSLTVVEFMRKQCENDYPNLKPEIESDLALWKFNEADVIRKTEAHWPDLVAKEPLVLKGLTQIEEGHQTMIDAFKRTQTPQTPDVFSYVCKNYFKELVSGIWRKRTPNVYKFIEQIE